jgi:hypothetical protein
MRRVRIAAAAGASLVAFLAFGMTNTVLAVIAVAIAFLVASAISGMGQQSESRPRIEQWIRDMWIERACARREPDRGNH